jgi:transposase
MKKHNYRTKKVNDINWPQLREQFAGQPLVFAVDVAKEQQFALLSNPELSESVLLQWNHLEQTAELINELKQLNTLITVVMESTSTYGDAMRYQFRQAGFTIHQACAKRVHDAKEIYDGVPSLHDAKAAWLIARLYKEGLTKPWHELDDKERELNAYRREYELHQSQHERNQNRLEAFLSRHWPEVLSLLALDSVTLENLLIDYGSPEQIATNAEQAAMDMRRWGKSCLSIEKIDAVIHSAATTLGQPCIEAEKHYLQALAEKLRHSRKQAKNAKQALEAVVKAEPGLKEMGLTIGMVTTAILIGLHLDPRHFGCARSYLKALGLNLKEKSSGQDHGKLKLTKRGSALARKYLYFAALRLIKSDPVVSAWYQSKVDPRAKSKTVIAFMRKLAMALWHVARGQRFDARKLVKAAVAN